MTSVSTYQRRSPKTSPRSAANTPNWQVNEDATRMIVTTSAYGTFSSVGLRRPVAPVVLGPHREEMANSPAKNISSLDSQTIVPTLTRFGRFSEWMRALMEGAAVVTRALWPPTNFYSLSGSSACRVTGRPRATTAPVVQHRAGPAARSSRVP